MTGRQKREKKSEILVTGDPLDWKYEVTRSTDCGKDEIVPPDGCNRYDYQVRCLVVRLI
jgi:hypothetical protein